MNRHTGAHASRSSAPVIQPGRPAGVLVLTLLAVMTGGSSGGVYGQAPPYGRPSPGLSGPPGAVAAPYYSGSGGGPPGSPGVGAPGSSLVFVRFAGSGAAKATYYPDSLGGRPYPAGARVGLRPGYVYRVKLSDIPGLPGVTLYPSIEVRGGLCLPPKLASADYPVTIGFGPEELERVMSGSVVVKAFALEDPDRAIPAATRADQPPEVDVPAGVDPVPAARTRGRLLLVVRLGERTLDEDDLRCQAIPGTMLLPGMCGMPPPQRPPQLAWACFPLFDPKLGPKPMTEECFRDGGDSKTPVGLSASGGLYGLDPTDTVAQYSDSHGRRRLSVSNVVCLCVPRYVAVVGEIRPRGYEGVVGLAGTELAQRDQLTARATPSLLTAVAEGPEKLRGRERLSVNLNTLTPVQLRRVEILAAKVIDIGPFALIGTDRAVQIQAAVKAHLLKQLEAAHQFTIKQGPAEIDLTAGTAVIGKLQGTVVRTGVQETRELNVTCCEPRLPDQPLLLHKWVDCKRVQVGDVVTFFIRYTNLGFQPITDVVVNDSLTGRLEYVPGSSKSDRDAVFTTEANEAGSAVLRWEVGGTLPPKQSGVVSFQARIR